MDYAIDLRKSSTTYKQFVCVELSAEDKKQFFIPRGFGHAVISLTDYSEIEYRVDNLYNKEYDRTISYHDEELNIPWPMDSIIVSEGCASRSATAMFSGKISKGGHTDMRTSPSLRLPSAVRAMPFAVSHVIL